MKRKILILVNHEVVVYNFRKELVEELLNEGYDVVISSPYGEKIKYFMDIGAQYVETKIDRQGKNPIKDFKLLNFYNALMKRISPDIVLTYTIKPNIFGGLAAKKNRIPYIANITGLGTAVEKKGFIQKLTLLLYTFAFSKVDTIFFQNQENMDFFKNKRIGLNKYSLIPGSGVNIDFFELSEYPPGETIEFVFISRLMKEKGIDLYIGAAKYFAQKYKKVKFHVCGFCEENYSEMLNNLHKNGTIIYHGMLKDIRLVLRNTHCTVHPTYYPEGLSNVLLESLATGRPVITTDRSGCRETVENGINGFLVKQNDQNDLIDKIQKFIDLQYYEKKTMGLNGRIKAVNEFDRRVVVKEYKNTIKRIIDN